MGKFLNIVLVICIIIIMSSLVYSEMEASPGDIQELLEKTKNHDELNKHTVEFFKNNPQPKIKDLVELKQFIEQTMIRDTLREATGDQSIKASYEIEAEKEKKSREELNEVMEMITFEVGGMKINMITIVLILSVPWLLLIFFRKMTY